MEIDRARTNLASWAEKLRAFEAYRGSAKLQARYQTNDFTVLIVCPSETRQRRIAEEVVKVTRHPSDRYRFLLTQQVHPTTVRAFWQQVSSFTWGRRQVVDRVVETPEGLQWSDAPLWNPTQ